MKELTPAEMAILGLINEGATYGYDLNKIIECRGMRAWTAIGFSSIYAILNRLEKKGLIQSSTATNGKLPLKKRYQITPQGQTTLQETVKQSLTKPENPRLRIDLGIANLGTISHEEVIACITTYIKETEAAITAFLKVRDIQEPLPFEARVLFEHSEIKARAELQWAKQFLSQLKAQGDKA